MFFLLRKLISFVAMLVFVVLAAINLYKLASDQRMEGIIPIIGGAAGAFAFKIGPWEDLHSLWWLPLILDVGCLPWLAVMAFGAFRKNL